MDKQKIFTAEQLGRVLQGYRKSQELTQTETASRVGLQQKTVSALEINTAASSIESLFKLLSALDLTISIESKKRDSKNNEAW